MSEVRSAVLVALLGLIACAVLISTQARSVGAEDDCADPTWMVQRVGPLGLFCIGEEGP